MLELIGLIAIGFGLKALFSSSNSGETNCQVEKCNGNTMNGTIMNDTSESSAEDNSYNCETYKDYMEEAYDDSDEQWSRSDLADYYGYQYNEDYSYEQFLDDM